jgi:hypothetical protein
MEEISRVCIQDGEWNPKSSVIQKGVKTNLYRVHSGSNVVCKCEWLYLYVFFLNMK